jgi:hypothetical protein
MRTHQIERFRRICVYSSVSYFGLCACIRYGDSAHVLDLRPLLTCTDSTVMVAAARVVGNMVRIAGGTLGDPFFTKEIGQALQMLEGKSSPVADCYQVTVSSVYSVLIHQTLARRSAGSAVSSFSTNSPRMPLACFTHSCRVC